MAQAPPAPLRGVSLSPSDDHPLSGGIPIQIPRLYTLSQRIEQLALHVHHDAPHIQFRVRVSHDRSSSRLSTPGDSPTNGTVRRLPTPTSNASSTSLSPSATRQVAAKSLRAPAPDPPPRFRAIPHLPNMLNVEPAAPGARLPYGERSPGSAFARTSSPSRITWRRLRRKRVFQGHVVFQYRCVCIITVAFVALQRQGSGRIPRCKITCLRCAARTPRLSSAPISSSLATYYNTVHVLNILTRRWSRPTFTTADLPRRWRAHDSAVPEQDLGVWR